jgi:glutamine phosphoribosylpyrophosphate amidotransferase
MSTSGNIEDAVKRCMRVLRGSFSVVMLIDGILYGFRDPLGIKPMVSGRLNRNVPAFKVWLLMLGDFIATFNRES